MKLEEVKKVLKALASGIHPETGEVLSEDSVINSPLVIRALHAALKALDTDPVKSIKTPGKDKPLKHGRTWSERDETELNRLFDTKMQVKEIAQTLNRTAVSVAGRLVKLGRIENRFCVSASANDGDTRK